MMKKSICLAILTAALLALSACGESSAADSSAAETTAVSGTDTTAASETAANTDITAADTTAAETETEAVTEAAATAAETAAVTEAAAAQTAAAPAADTGWKDAYKEVIAQFKSETDAADAKWDLQDLDQDGTPELLLSEGGYHAGSVRYYYYENGKAAEMQDADGEPLRYGCYGEVLICPEEHLLGSQDMHMGYTFASMSKYENHALTSLFNLDENSGAVGEETVTYNVNHTAVTKEEYDAKLSEFNAKNWKNAGAKYSLDDLSALS